MATPGHHGGRPGGTVTEWNIVPLDPPEVAAFWKAIGARPDDQLPRLVFADWLDERAGTVECPEPGCGNPAIGWNGFHRCRRCSGTGYVGNGYAELAAALLAMADRVPKVMASGSRWYFYGHNDNDVLARDFHAIPTTVREKLSDWPGDKKFGFATAESAVRDLCRAWVKANTNPDSDQ